jgi:hypothetical protein
MGLKQPKTIFGIHSMTPYNIDTKVPYGIARVLQGSTLSLEGEVVELFGGSSKFAWALEDGDFTTAEISFSMSEYPDWLFEIFGGKAPTTRTAETSGDVTDLEAAFGTIIGAAGLLATITTTDAANLKTGTYSVQATAADAFAVYAMTNVDFGRGDELDFSDESLKIAEFTGVAGEGSVHAIPELGISFTTGASAAAFTIGDSATFQIRAINQESRDVIIGGIADIFPEFGAFLYAQKSGSGQIFEIDAFKCKALGLGLGAERKQFGQNDYTAKLSYDASRNGILRIREVR